MKTALRVTPLVSKVQWTRFWECNWCGGVAEGTRNLGGDSGEEWLRWSFLPEASLINPCTCPYCPAPAPTGIYKFAGDGGGGGGEWISGGWALRA